MEHDGIKGIIESGHPPGKSGGSKGPGCSAHEFVFDRPRPQQDILRTAKIMENDGKMTLGLEKQIKKKLAKLEANPPKPVDYGKDGHVLDDQ